MRKAAPPLPPSKLTLGVNHHRHLCRALTGILIPLPCSPPSTLGKVLGVIAASHGGTHCGRALGATLCPCTPPRSHSQLLSDHPKQTSTRRGTGDTRQDKLLLSTLISTPQTLGDRAAAPSCAQTQPCNRGHLPLLHTLPRESCFPLLILNCYFKIGNKVRQVNRAQMESKLLFPRLQGSRLIWFILPPMSKRYMSPPPPQPVFSFGSQPSAS